MTPGRFKIEDLAILCIIGVYPHERKRERKVFLDIEYDVDVSQALEKDAFGETIDYEKVATLCIELAQKKRYFLLETLAKEALDALFAAFPLLWARITVKKPKAVPGAQRVTLTMERTR